MNSLIWKGVDSTTKKGLIITSLPPITKPPMRVKETTIDGRDGSIIEELGYEPYDKEVKVGLTRDFDIDSIIAYFTGAGQLVMSNEPDKVYDAQIIGQIDYERLLRFRTASVKFRVQPYKHKWGESPSGAGTVVNSGNVESKPIITMQGSGTVEVKIGDVTQFSYTFPDGETEVVIDSEKEDAYLGNVLKNRNMTGEFLKLAVGSNEVSYTGTATAFQLSRVSRWI